MICLYTWLFRYLAASPQHIVFKPVTLQTNALPGSFTPAGFRFAHPQASKSQIEMSSSNFTFWELIESAFIFAALLRQASFGFLPAFLTRAFAFARNIHMNCIYLPFMRICLCGSDGFFHDVPLRVSSTLPSQVLHVFALVKSL